MDNPELKTVAYLALPLIIMVLFSVAVILFLWRIGFEMMHLEVTLLVLIVAFIFEALLFNNDVLRRVANVKKIEKMLLDQEQGGRLLIRRDLELTKVNEELHQLDERKSEFVSIVAHQLRTPLSGIKWTLDMIINGDLGALSNDQKTYLMKAYESNERMIGLIDDMLGADRIESGKFQYTFQETNVLDVLDSVLFELLPATNKKRITIAIVADRPAIPKALVDQEKIRAVFQNLLDNAIKYTHYGGKITISAAAAAGFIKFSIADNGIGIPKEQQKNIFQRFFRASNALKVQTDGSGLGLFIVKSIIERHGGTIWFESHENQGTTFHFTISIKN